MRGNMHKACPLSELAPGEALRLDSALPIAVFHIEVKVLDGDIMVIKSKEAPTFLPA